MDTLKAATDYAKRLEKLIKDARSCYSERANEYGHLAAEGLAANNQTVSDYNRGKQRGLEEANRIIKVLAENMELYNVI